jgi:predicted nucleic acid-binding protein
MIVYVESNFLLELILQQGQRAEATALVEWARAKTIQLRVPAFSLVEPDWTLRKNATQREQAIQPLTAEQVQLSRSAHRRHLTGIIEELTGRLRELRMEDVRGYEQVLSEMLATTTVLDLTSNTVSESMRLRQQFGLQVQDAVVLATILADVALADRKEALLFVTRDSDFANPDIVAELAKCRCPVVTDFASAVEHIRRSIQ